MPLKKHPRLQIISQSNSKSRPSRTGIPTALLSINCPQTAVPPSSILFFIGDSQKPHLQFFYQARVCYRDVGSGNQTQWTSLLRFYLILFSKSPLKSVLFYHFLVPDAQTVPCIQELTGCCLPVTANFINEQAKKEIIWS